MELKYQRLPNGHFIPGGIPDELPPEYKAKLRESAIKRALTSYRKVSVDSIIYPNLTRAAKALGISPRAIGRYASDPKKPSVFFVN